MGRRAGSGAERERVGSLGLFAVGLLYFIGQVLLISPRRAVSWDEAIYLSQVTRGATALAFAPSRARGVTLLVLPIARFTTSSVAVRVWLAVGSSMMLVYAFRAWRPLLGGAATLGAVMFAGTWLALLYGSEVMPNLWSALLATAASGYAARYAWGGKAKADLVKASVLLALMALFRPPDAAILSVVLATVIAVREEGLRRAALWLPGGAAVGWIPWLVEMQVRFGLATGLSDATGVSHVSTGGLATRLFQHLGLTDGPTIGPVPGASIPVAGAIWWALLVVMSILAIRMASKTDRGPSLVAAVAGAVLAAEYLVLISGLAPRFLLPAYALLSLTAAACLHCLFEAGRRRAGLVAVAIVVFLLAWQVGVAVRIGNEVEAARASDRNVGLAVSAAAGERDCALLASDSYPQIGFAAGCIARPGDGRGTTAGWLDGYAARGYAVFVVTKGTPSEPPFPNEFPGPPGWHIFGPG